jgi:hypothetical protein
VIWPNPVIRRDDELGDLAPRFGQMASTVRACRASRVRSPARWAGRVHASVAGSVVEIAGVVAGVAAGIVAERAG